MADQRIQYTEKMVGANHPTKADTLNRLSLVEHNNDGTHGAVTATSLKSSGKVVWNKGADIASATTLTLGADGNLFDVTGTNAITAIATKGIGFIAVLQFDGALTLTHHATNLVLPQGINITTIAGDIAVFYEYATGMWRLISFSRPHPLFSGALVQNSTAKTLTTGVSTTLNFDTEVYDTDAFHDLVTNTDRLTVPGNLGSVVYVRLYASAVFSANTTGSRALTFLKNGGNVAGLRGLNVGAAGTGTTDLSIVTPPIPVTAGDYFQVQGYQDSGGNLDILADWTFSFGLEVIR